ncbi:MAG: hypothetical protein M1833_002050 [Piccolia ochrophora]|nr:MAG: hypothetical protein M1833_002050 [Piccolia ochrophora]
MHSEHSKDTLSVLPDPSPVGASEKPFKPDKRWDLETGQAACWPSTGGVWIKSMTPVELFYTGLDRFNDVPKSSAQAEEDAFCDQLRKVGAQFYNLPPEWREGYVWCDELDSCADPVERVPLVLGFTVEGGVWVLDMSDGYDQFGPGAGGLFNALTMEERCAVIEKLGGKFCSDMKECPETANLVN